jgi:ribosome-binding factor A
MKKGGGMRPIRVAAEIKKVMSEFFLRESLPDCGVDRGEPILITEVIVTSCLRHAKIHVTCLSDAGLDCAELLNRHTPRLRYYLGTKICLRFVPELTFIPDDSYACARRIQNLLAAEQASLDRQNPSKASSDQTVSLGDTEE